MKGVIRACQVFQLRTSFEKDKEKLEAMWERQHEHAADKIYAMCVDLGGFFLKVLGKEFHFGLDRLVW